MDFLTNNLGLLGGGGATAVILFVLKKIPNEKIYSNVEKVFESIGRICTLNLSRWAFTKKYWSVVEDYLIDLIDNTVGAAVNGLIKGLKSDDR